MLKSYSFDEGEKLKDTIFCIECGKTGIKLYDDKLCITCFSQKTILLSYPAKLDLILCKHCGNKLTTHKGTKYIQGGPDSEQSRTLNSMIYDELREVVKPAGPKFKIKSLVADLQFDPNLRSGNAKFKAVVCYEDLDLNTEAEIKFEIKYSTCKYCARARGNYYEALIQVRCTSPPRKLTDDELNSIRECIYSKVAENPEPSFITREVELRRGEHYLGLDVYLSSVNLARNIARMLASTHKAQYTESPKLVGRREGRNLYRVTFAVRLPPYKVGDFVKIVNIDRIGKIVAFKKKQVKIELLPDGREYELSRRVIDKQLKFIGGEEIVKRAQVITANATELLVLDPEDYTPRSLPRPEKLKIEHLQYVNVLKYDNQLYIV